MAVAFLAISYIAGRWFFPHVLAWVARRRSQELFTLTIFALALGMATVSDRGFTLAETLIALGILSIVVVGVLAAFSVQSATNSRSEQRTEATAAAAQVVEFLLKDPSPLVRRAAVDAVARLEPATAEESLRLALGDEASIVRIAAAGALGVALRVAAGASPRRVPRRAARSRCLRGPGSLPRGTRTRAL